MENKAIEFYRSLVKANIDKAKDTLSDVKYKVYIAIVDSCDDLEKLKDMADFDMQCDFLEYAKSIHSELGKYNTTLEELQAASNGYEVIDLKELTGEKQAVEQERKAEINNTIDNLVNNFDNYDGILERLAMLEEVEDKDQGEEIRMELELDNSEQLLEEEKEREEIEEALTDLEEELNDVDEDDSEYEEDNEESDDYDILEEDDSEYDEDSLDELLDDALEELEEDEDYEEEEPDFEEVIFENEDVDNLEDIDEINDIRAEYDELYTGETDILTEDEAELTQSSLSSGTDEMLDDIGDLFDDSDAEITEEDYDSMDLFEDDGEYESSINEDFDSDEYNNGNLDDIDDIIEQDDDSIDLFEEEQQDTSIGDILEDDFDEFFGSDEEQYNLDEQFNTSGGSNLGSTNKPQKSIVNRSGTKQVFNTSTDRGKQAQDTLSKVNNIINIGVKKSKNNYFSGKAQANNMKKQTAGAKPKKPSMFNLDDNIDF